MNIKYNVSQTNFSGIKRTLPLANQTKLISSVQGSYINSAAKNLPKSATNKGFVFTAITAFFLGIAKLFKRTPKTKETEIKPTSTNNEINKVKSTPAPAKEKLEPTPENFKILKQKIAKGVNYEKEINFANIEILQKLPEDQKERITSYLQTNYEDAKNFLAFAAGETPATLQCDESNYDNIYNSLYGNDINVINLFWDKGGEVLINRKAVKKVISENLEFFKCRLDLPTTATINDVEKKLFFCAYNSPLRSKKNYADLLEIITGNDIYDACHKQIVKDISRTNMIFFPGCADNLEEYKTILKKSVLGKNSSYCKMPQSFKDKLIKSIDSIPEEAFKSRIAEPVEFIREHNSELAKFRSMERLAEKLEKAQKESTTIKIENR